MAEPYDILTTPGFLVRRLQQIITSIFYDQIGDADITIGQYVALWGIDTNPGIDQLRLGRIVALDRSTIGTAVEGLKRRKLIIWRTAKADRRYKEIYATKKGGALLKELEPSIKRVQQILLDALTPSEVPDFLRMLAKIVEVNNGLSRVPIDKVVVRTPSPPQPPRRAPKR